MKKLIIILWLINAMPIFSIGNDRNDQIKNECLTCHVENELMPEDYSEFDIHFRSGILCENCHGGNSKVADEELSMSESNGFIGVPNRKDVTAFCGKCHSDIKYMKQYRPRIETDQVERYYTSKHGIGLKNGDEQVAVCTSCHTAHSILPANDPRSSTYALNIPTTCNNCHGDIGIMKKYNLDTKILEDFSKGVHGIALLVNKDVGAPSCNDCHGNHGATPPGINSVSNVCGMCHVNNLNYYKQSMMAQPFQDLEFHGCEECHSNHNILKPNDNMVGVSDESNCVNCHVKGDEGYSEAEKINVKLTNLSRIIDSANIKLSEVRSKGMNDIDIEYILKEANQSLIQSRTLVHTFDSKKVGEKTNEGIQAARTALSKSNEEINDYQVRRNGFGAATLAITILIIALYFKTRDLDKK
jgi:Cytochrome c3/Cytochrome c554 and c-prime